MMKLMLGNNNSKQVMTQSESRHVLKYELCLVQIQFDKKCPLFLDAGPEVADRYLLVNISYLIGIENRDMVRKIM
jgi:hypothetical protein